MADNSENQIEISIEAYQKTMEELVAQLRQENFALHLQINQFILDKKASEKAAGIATEAENIINPEAKGV